MANEQNLAPRLPDTNVSQIQAERGRKGGSVRSINKKIAARLRHLKKKGLTNEKAKMLFDMLTNENFSSFEIYLYLEAMKGMAKTLNDKDIIMKHLLKWHASHHGQKHKIEGDLNHNVQAIQVNIIYPNKQNKNEKIK